ncbi:MAG: hypothetical protein C0469_04025 [Cyanobacteria bacterium DS2.3.42]|nr:hypothetical protein [Cyanobacteria bacterium DS2.3.42]
MLSPQINRLIALFLCSVFLQQQVFAAALHNSDKSTTGAWQAAEVLQIRPEVERLAQMMANSEKQPTDEEVQLLRAFVLRKILLGFLDVRRACNKTEIELAYTYAILQREQRLHDAVHEMFNLANFAQFSALYTIEPYSRINLQFNQSAILTCVGAGVGTTLPILSILYNKYATAHHTSPTDDIHPVVNGGPVDAQSLSPTVDRYLDSVRPGAVCSRREELFALWKERYGVNARNVKSLCSLSDPGGKGFGLLNTRIVLLWSLHSQIQEFDQQLLLLLNLVRSTTNEAGSGDNWDLTLLGLKPGASEAAQLLNVKSVVGQLVQMKGSSDTRRAAELDLQLQEAILAGMLDVRIATDKIDDELNYSYDVVLSRLLMRRGKLLQWNYDANFIQTGIFSAIAGLLFLQDYPKAGNQLFIVQSSIGTLLSALGLALMHGGWRKIDTPPNSLAAFFNLESSYSFSPMIAEFLNSPSPASKKQSRRTVLIEGWKSRRVATLNLDKPRNRDKIAATGSCKFDTIKIVQNRIDLLHSLKASLEEIDAELFELAQATEPYAPSLSSVHTGVQVQIEPHAADLAKILGIRNQVEYLTANKGQPASSDLLMQKLAVSRRVIIACLDVRKAVDSIDLQIATETTAMDRLKRMRQMAISLTNNANFFQINLLGIISDGPLGLSSNPKLNLYGNRLNIVSGYMIGGLAGLSFLEQPGGIRLVKAQPNAIGPAFGIGKRDDVLSANVVTFLNSVPPTSTNGLTRAQGLLKYWKTSKVMSMNVTKKSTLEKVAANSPTQHFYFERIKLIENRVHMLYDLRAVIDLMNIGLSEVLRSID